MKRKATAAAPVDSAAAENDRLQREIDRLHDDLDSMRDERDSFERDLDDALREKRQLEREHAAEEAKSFRPDVRRMDRGDWTHASCNQFCDVCGFQYWEHPTVPGYEWVRRICDGRLVKL